jgi:hypothetical protein
LGGGSYSSEDDEGVGGRFTRLTTLFAFSTITGAVLFTGFVVVSCFTGFVLISFLTGFSAGEGERDLGSGRAGSGTTTGGLGLFRDPLGRAAFLATASILIYTRYIYSYGRTTTISK